MKTNKYKILVLSDLNKNTDSILKNTVSLSKMIDAEIDFFHVKKPIDIVERESQLSAMRVINKEQLGTKKKIQEFLDPFSKSYDVNINFTFAFGNIKHEIKEHIKTVKPDIIVLGKRKAKTMRFIGDNITDFVLKTHKGAIMIASSENVLEPKKEFNLGLFNGKVESFKMTFVENLIAQTQKPLKSFNIIESNALNEQNNTPLTEKTVDYVFDKNDNAIKNLSNYLVKNKVNLLCVNRGKSKKKSKALKSEINDIIDEVNVSLLITDSEQKQTH
ncbi:hypothetical protein GCM10023311_21000 [Flaviramulus aquimarinus]|uniref:UspA domain-containing protein n=1 Tax=Flaviramulus aquimarinus TaxID=1170456 RepID=A0ABP9F8U2_9FLAO